MSREDLCRRHVEGQKGEHGGGTGRRGGGVSECVCWGGEDEGEDWAGMRLCSDRCGLAAEVCARCSEMLSDTSEGA